MSDPNNTDPVGSSGIGTNGQKDLPTSNWKDALGEAVKSFIRIGFLGGLVAALGVMMSGIHTDTGVILINWAVASASFLAVAGASLIVSIDKFIHEWDGTAMKGLTGF